MNASDFRRLALSLEGAEEGSHMGAADFRVGGHIFATLASVKQGYGNLMLTPEQQAAFVAEAPGIFLPIPGGWGKNGATHVVSPRRMKIFCSARSVPPGNFASKRTRRRVPVEPHPPQSPGQRSRLHPASASDANPRIPLRHNPENG